MSTEGASHLLEAVFVGLVVGAVVAIPAHLLLTARNLRWTWALIPTAAGALAVWATLVETWSVALLVGGACTARWAYLRERRDREAGEDDRRDRGQQADRLPGHEPPSRRLVPRACTGKTLHGSAGRPASRLR